MEIRVCTKCGEEKPATSEFFYKHVRCPLGIRPECKVCTSAYSKRYYRGREQEYAKRQQDYIQSQFAAIYQIKNKETGKWESVADSGQLRKEGVVEDALMKVTHVKKKN